MRKTKVRIVGDPDLADQILEVLVQHFELAEDTQRYETAVGRDYSHSCAPGVTIYVPIKRQKVNSL